MAAKSSLKKWFPTETYPIFAIVGIAVGGAGYYLFKLSQGPEVTWNRYGDWKPWDKVKQHENLKFLSIDKEFWAKRKAAALAEQGEKRMVDAI